MILQNKTTIYAVLALATVVAFVVTYWKGRSDGKESAREAMQAQVYAANLKTAQTEQQARRISEELDSEYQTELAQLDTRYRDAVARIGPVRVRQCTDSSHVPGVPDTATGDHGAAGGNGFPEKAGEPDIGPGLAELAKLADQQTHRLIACQQWILKQREASVSR